jgi:hypothetical protein
LDFVIVSNLDPVPLNKLFAPPVDPKIDPDAPVFDAGPVSRRADIDHAFGMAPKPRDPAVDAAIEAYLAKHGSRTRPPVARPVEGAPSERQTKQAYEMRSDFLVHDAKGKVARPKQVDHAAIAKELESFPWKDGVTRIPTGFATTKYGMEAALAFAGYVPAKGRRAAYDRQANADHQHSRRYPEPGSSGHRSEEEIREVLYADGSNLSYQAGFLSLANDLENVCAFPPCLKPLKKGRHSDSRYCVGKNCAQRDRRRLAKLNVSDANQPLRRKFFCTEVEPTSDAVDIIYVSSLMESEVVSENTYEGFRSFRDDPIGQLAAQGEITQAQYYAAVDYMVDLDEVNARLRAPHRDELDISVWIPREPDSNARLATEIKRSKYPSPLARIRAANKAMGRAATALIHAALASNTIDDVEMLRVALDALITSRKPQWTKPREKSSIRSTSPSPALQESEF